MTYYQDILNAHDVLNINR